MSYPQAFHTSCRLGLSGVSGFQVNAASPSLTREQLADLSRSHARYQAPPDLPFEPTLEEMQSFPVALRASRVASVGQVVSRTQYVGREYRGRDGGPDEGRFGNYFCHMVIAPEGDDAFEGLAPVELWDAPHWTTTEANDTELPELGPLSPGPLDPARTIQSVSTAPPGLVEALVDAVLAAMNGGRPVLLIEPDPARAIAWATLVTFSLPPVVAGKFSFSTFEGRPQDIVDLHLVVTTPACDPGPATQSSLTRLEASASPSAEPRSLYARALGALMEQGPEAVLDAVRAVRGASAAEWGASLTALTGLTRLVTADDLPSVLDEALARVDAGRLEDAARVVRDLPASPDGDARVLPAWADLYGKARGAEPSDAARELASISLGRLVAHIDLLPDTLPAIPVGAPNSPAVGPIGAWLRDLESRQGTDATGLLLQRGVALGLVGVNVPVDARVARVVEHDLEQPEMVRTLDVLNHVGAYDRLFEQVVLAVADAPQRDPQARGRLRVLSRYASARDVICQRAANLGTFDAELTWQRMRAADDPGACASAARALVERAADSAAEAEIRELWGETGPVNVEDADALLTAYLDLDRVPPALDVERACRLLMSEPLPRRHPRGGLGYTLARLPDAKTTPEICAWASAFVPVTEKLSLVTWSKRAARAFHAQPSRVPEERWSELVEAIADVLVPHRYDRAFSQALGAFAGPNFAILGESLGQALARELETADDRSTFAADEFTLWIATPPRDLIDLILPTAFGKLSERDLDDAAEIMSAELVPHWEAWRERHPRTGARAAVSRMLGRLSRDRDENDQ